LAAIHIDSTTIRNSKISEGREALRTAGPEAATNFGDLWKCG